MYYIVVATHGKLGYELVSSMEMIIGKQKKIIVIGLKPEDDPKILKESFRECVINYGKDNLIFLVDLLGGVVSNMAKPIAREGIPVITGVNLPMLLEVVASRYASSEIDPDYIVRICKNSIWDLRSIIRREEYGKE